MTKEHERRFARVGSQRETTDDPLVILKLFDPCGRWTYYATEYDAAEEILYGFCVSPLGPDCDEWGYASLAEIRDTRNRFGLYMERDKYFHPTPISSVLRELGLGLEVSDA